MVANRTDEFQPERMEDMTKVNHGEARSCIGMRLTLIEMEPSHKTSFFVITLLSVLTICFLLDMISNVFNIITGYSVTIYTDL